MFKFFRKYNTWLVVIGGAFLMVAFLVPQAIQMIGQNPSNTPYATFNLGDPVRVFVEDYDQAQRERLILNSIRFNQPEAGGQPIPLGFVLGITEIDQWMVLSMEAERAGLVGGPGEGERLFQLVAADVVDRIAQRRALFARAGADITPLSQEEATELLRNIVLDLQATRDGSIGNRATPEFIDQTLAKAAGVRRLAQLYSEPLPASVTESWAVARELGDSATVSAAFLSAEERADDLAEPTPGQLLAHFDEYAASDPSETPLGVGYILEPAVQFEALVIRAGPLQQAVPLDEIEINAFWRRNRVDFPGDFASSRARVEDRLRRDRAAEQLRRIEELVRRPLYASQLKLETREDGSKVLPSDWAAQRPAIESLAGEVAATLADELGVEASAIEGAFDVVRRDGSFRTRDLIATDPAVGRASLPGAAPGQGGAMADVLLAARELQGEDASSRVQSGLLFGPLVLPDGGLVYPRILAVRPRGAPESLDAVRDDVVAGVRLVESFTRLEEDAGGFVDRVAQAGDFAPLLKERGVEILGNATVTTRGVAPVGAARPRALPLNTPDFRELVLDRARALAEQADTAGVTIAELPQGERMVTLAIPSARGLAVARIDAFDAITPERYASPLIVSQLEQTLQLRSAIRSSPLAWPSVQDRTEFTLIRRAGEPEFADLDDAEAESEDSAEAAAGG